MKPGKRAFLSMLLAFALSAIPAAAQQQHGDKEYQPHVGQAGKDVIWVPTPIELVEKMLQMARITPEDFVIDLGSGDGRIAITAAKKFGVRAMGIEYNPDMVGLSNREAQRQGVADRVKFVHGDVFESDFSQATIITMYLLPDLNLRLRPKILEMRPGTRVTSHAFDMGEWKPDETTNADHRTGYLWIVPAKVAGTWSLRVDGSPQVRELALKQNFQEIEGQLRGGAAGAALVEPRLRGEQVSFRVMEGNVRREFTGRVSGNTMQGTVRAAGAPELKWSASRR